MTDWLADLASWAWDRHHNVLSWYIRPLFFLPFCWFAYRRSAAGIVLTLLALVTSMAWFPAPAQPDPAVARMLEVERDYLLGTWTAAKVAMALLVPLAFAGIAAALWRRSIGWALVVINAAVLVKVAWTYGVDDQGAGATEHLVPALLGLAVVDVALMFAARRLRRRAAGRATCESPPCSAAAAIRRTRVITPRTAVPPRAAQGAPRAVR